MFLSNTVVTDTQRCIDILIRTSIGICCVNKAALRIMMYHNIAPSLPLAFHNSFHHQC